LAAVAGEGARASMSDAVDFADPSEWDDLIAPANPKHKAIENLQSGIYNHPAMAVTLRSFAKINLGLCIGPKRPDGFHDLRTVYQTVALHDVIRVQAVRGSGIEIHCRDPRVPTDESNTCYRMVERAIGALKASGRVVLEIKKRLPVQGGLGGASGNAVAALLGLEAALKKRLSGPERLRVAAEIGSDIPLFLVGGTVLGVGHGEEVYPLSDLPAAPCVIATPEIGISTPQAFADWDSRMAQAEKQAERGARRNTGKNSAKLTGDDPSDRMNEFSRRISSWLSDVPQRKSSGGRLSGVPAGGRGRAETLLLDLVRTGIENDFEQVVFPQYPALRDVKCALERAGAEYASLAGSGSALYGLFKTKAGAEKAAARLRKEGVPAQATVTLTRQQYWSKFLVSGF
jgi:4-diphosphocytidyl-2-C-methyl-D-erythritol kinase